MEFHVWKRGRRGDALVFRGLVNGSFGQWLHTGACEAQGAHTPWQLEAGKAPKGKVAQEIPASLKRWSVLWNNMGTSDIMYYLRAWHIKIQACECL